MAKYGTYDPFAPDPILEARRRGDNGFRDNSIAEAAHEQLRNRLNERADTGAYGAGPGDISLSSVAARVAPKAPEPSQVAKAPEATARVEDSLRGAAAPSKLFDDARASLARGAYASPEWKTDYSLASVAQDEAARADISDRTRAGMERNNAEEALRGDPMSLAINARRKTLDYENLLPAYSGVDREGHPIPYEPSLRLQDKSRGDTGLTERRQDNAPSWPLRGDVAGIDRANAIMKPKERLEMDQAANREDAVRKIRETQAQVERDVVAKKRTRAEGDQFLKSVLLDAATKGALSEGDYKALADFMFPRASTVIPGTE